MLENNNNSNPDIPLNRRLTVHGDSIMRKIPSGAEAAVVMVATDDAFEEMAMTLVRLEEATVFENFLEVPTPLRFIFFMVGPSFADTDYHEIGRAMATLFSDEVGDYTICEGLFCKIHKKFILQNLILALIIVDNYCINVAYVHLVIFIY